MITEQQVATSGIVLTRVARAIGTTPSSLAKDLSATVSGTTATGSTANILSINCAMPTAIEAQRCSAAAAAAYMAFGNETNQPKTVRAHDPMHVTLITAATLPAAPTGPGKGILLPAGAILELLLGIGAILVRDRFDHRVRDRADLERCLGGPVLAAIPLVQHPDDVFLRHPLSRSGRGLSLSPGESQSAHHRRARWRCGAACLRRAARRWAYQRRRQPRGSLGRAGREGALDRC